MVVFVFMNNKLRKRFLFSLWVGLSFASVVKAQTRVAWLEIKDKSGTPVQLEPDFYYAHVAIGIGNRWLHAHPNRGVELVDRETLNSLGEIQEILASEDENEKYLNQIENYLGKPFDSEFDWSDEKIYCAELVAKLLNVPPSPMHFDNKYWNPWYQKYEGKPGSSPSKLYSELKSRGYENIFEGN
jgi:hypothetical protein